MSKLKIKNKYGIAPNRLLNSKEISLGAKGLFTFLQSKPEGWSFSVKRISNQTKDGKDGITSKLRELEKAGYLKRIPVKDKNGKWDGYDYLLSDLPFTENPSTEKPLTENPATLSKKDNSNKDYSNKEVESNQVAQTRNYFKDQCKSLKGFEPEMAFGKEGKLIKDRLKRYSLEELKDLIDKFLNSKIGDELGFSLGICLSSHTVNLWKAGNLDKKKRPYYEDMRIIERSGKKFCIPNDGGEWLEFAGKESDIIWK